MTHLLDKKYVIVLPEGATAQLVPENTYKTSKQIETIYII